MTDQRQDTVKAAAAIAVILLAGGLLFWALLGRFTGYQEYGPAPWSEPPGNVGK